MIVFMFLGLKVSLSRPSANCAPTRALLRQTDLGVEVAMMM